MEIRKLMEEMKDVLFILLVTAFFTWIANCIQLPKVNMAESSIGVLLLVVITQWFDPQNRLAQLKRICHHRITVNTYLILIIVWWIARNILPIFRDTTLSIL